MSTSLPCPNPTCTHVFSQQEIQGATVLKCPKCGTAFQLRPAGPARAKPAAPAPPRRATPAPAKPASPARPVAKAIPTAKPALPKTAQPAPAKVPVARPASPPPAQPARPPKNEPTDDFLADEPLPPEAEPEPLPLPAEPASPPANAMDNADVAFAGEPVITTQWRRRSSLIGKILGLGAILLILGSIGFSIYLIMTQERNTPTGPPPPFYGKIRTLGGGEETAFKLLVPKNIWSDDTAIRSRLRANIALRRTEPDAWFAIATKDYGGQKPRDAELLREGVERLESLFGKEVELGKTADKVDWSGKPVQRLEFQGQLNAVLWRGDFYWFTQHGIGYWFFMAAASVEDVQQELQTLKENNCFEVQTERGGWTEQPPKLEAFQGGRLPIEIKAPPGVWQKYNALDEDERADLVLAGRYLKEKDNRKNAMVMVLTLPKQTDLKEGVKAAIADLEIRKSNDAQKVKVVSLDMKEEGKSEAGPPVDIGAKRGRIVEFQMQVDNTPKRFILMAIINEEEHLLVIHCECVWEHRQIWRQDFLDLLQSLTVKK